MASKRNNTICILFDKVPKGTGYRKGAYSWVQEDQAKEYIKDGYGKEYNPATKKVVGEKKTKKK